MSDLERNGRRSMTVIGVTGAAGFVGRALCQRLEREGRTVVPLVRTARGHARERVVGSIDGSTDWSGLLEGLDAVVHLAARVHVMHDRAADPLIEFLKVNRDGTATLARFASIAGVRRFVFVSTIKVNGEATPPGAAFTAEDPPAPIDPYGISKLEAEQALAEIDRASGMAIVIMRPPLVYGPGVAGNFRSMIAWVKRGIPLPLGMATGNRRSLVALDNLVDLICRSIDHPNAPGRPLLVADARSLSTAELLRELAEALGRKARLVPVPVPILRGLARILGKTAEADRLLGSLEVDIGDTRARLGWNPPVSVEEGLRKTVEAFQRKAP